MSTKSRMQATRTELRVENSFQVGGHVLRVTREMEGRWSVALDGGALPGSYRTQADAWEAGVREAYRLDRPAQ